MLVVADFEDDTDDSYLVSNDVVKQSPELGEFHSEQVWQVAEFFWLEVFLDDWHWGGLLLLWLLWAECLCNAFYHYWISDMRVRA